MSQRFERFRLASLGTEIRASWTGALVPDDKLNQTLTSNAGKAAAPVAVAGAASAGFLLLQPRAPVRLEQRRLRRLRSRQLRGRAPRARHRGTSRQQRGPRRRRCRRREPFCCCRFTTRLARSSASCSRCFRKTSASPRPSIPSVLKTILEPAVELIGENLRISREPGSDERPGA